MRANSQNAGKDDFSMFMGGNKVLELNPKHPLITNLAASVKANEADQKNSETVALVYDLAQLAAGYVIEDTGSFAKRVANMLVNAMGEAPVSAPASSKPEEAPKVVDTEIVE